LSSTSPTERLMAGSLSKNHLSIVGSLYEQPLRLTAIGKAVGLDNSYASRLLKELEGHDLVRRLDSGYALTPLGANTFARIVEPGWAHKARRFLIMMLDLLDKVGVVSVRELCQRVTADLNVAPTVAERLVTRSLGELESTGRLSVQGDLVSLKATPFATAKVFEEIKTATLVRPQRTAKDPVLADH
jgi:DNA-binding MarR family transcriptional regulator